MTPEPLLGIVEYELTDELALKAARTLFDVRTWQVKKDVLREGMPHPTVPLVAGMVMLLMAQVAGLIAAWDSLVGKILFFAGFFVHLLLLYKLALYFWPRFGDWYIRRTARQMVRGLSSRTIRWTLFEDRLETSSAVSQRKLAWSKLQEVELFPELWCLHWPALLQLIVPVGALSEPVRVFILRKAGSKIARHSLAAGDRS